MLGSDARRIASAIEERVNTGSNDATVAATVGADRIRPQVNPPPGAARPTIVRYYIDIADGTRTARLELDEAADLLDEVQPGWTPDQLFAAISSRDVPVEKVEEADGE